MLSNTFLRINNKIYNINCIEHINISSENKFSDEDGWPFERIQIFFKKSYDFKPLNFFSYFQDIERVLYDWQHQKSNLFEIYYLTLEDIKKIHSKEKNHEKEFRKYEEEENSKI